MIKEHYPNSRILADHYSLISDDIFKDSDFINGHFGLSPIQENTTTFTILRDPIDRTFSYMVYVWMNYFSQNYSIDKILDFFINTEKIRNNMSNMQTKFLTGYVDYDKYNSALLTEKYIERIYNNWFIVDNSNSVIDSIKKNSITLLDYNDSKLYRKICEIYEMPETKRDRENETIKDFDYLKKIFYKDLCEMNKEDILLYNSFMI